MVKRLSEFKGKEGLKVAARIMAPVGKLMRGKDGIDLAGKSVLEYFSELMEQDYDSVYELMAVLSGEDPKTYSCTGGEALSNLSLMIGDPDLMLFFGLRRQEADSSGDASGGTEAQKT